MTHTLFRARRLLVAAGVGLAALLVGGDSLTNAALPKTGKIVDEAQAVSDQQLSLAIVVLHSVKRSLDAADHDYGGHRAAVVVHTSSAEFEIRQALGHRVPGVGPIKIPTIRESQIYSNAQLASAIPVLADTAALLTNAGHDYGGHRVKAIGRTEAAIVELELALEYISKRKKRLKAFRVIETEVVVYPIHRSKLHRHKKLIAMKKAPGTKSFRTAMTRRLGTAHVAMKYPDKRKRHEVVKLIKVSPKRNLAQHTINKVAKTHFKPTISMTRPRPSMQMHARRR